jgi:LPXTG-motif cell wall-anchored protein
VFRVVKATGSDDEVKGGGFWSTSYYISRTEEDSSASQSSISPTSPSATSSTPEASRTSSPTSTPPSTLTGAPIVSSTQPSSGVGTGAIIGLAVGLSLALIIIVAGAFLILRRRKQKSTNRSSVHQPPELPATTDIYGHGVTKGDAYTDVPHEVYVQPSEMQGSNTFFELPASRSSPRV